MFNSNQIKADVRLGKDPEVKTIKDGITVANCSAAISIGKKDENKDPIWVNLKAWNYAAEILGSLSKGDAVRVDGHLDEDRWEKDGEKHTRLVIVCDSITKAIFAKRKEKTKDREPGDNQDDKIPF